MKTDKENTTIEIEYLISIFDKVFGDLGQTPLLENEQFLLDELSFDKYLKFNSKEKAGRIKIAFEITTAAVTFYIDRTSEIPEWTYAWIKENPLLFETEIKNIFSNTILIEYKGNKTIINLLNGTGQIIRIYKFYNGLFLNLFSKKVIYKYRPFFEA